MRFVEKNLASDREVQTISTVVQPDEQCIQTINSLWAAYLNAFQVCHP